MALITPTIKTDTDRVTGRYSAHHTWTLAFATSDTMTPIAVDPRTQRISVQITPVGSGTGNVQGALTQAAPAAGDWINSSLGSVSAVGLGTFAVIPKFIQALVTAGTVRVDVWLWG